MIGADGANSRVAKEIDAGDYDYAIAFQVQQRDALTVMSAWRLWHAAADILGGADVPASDVGELAGLLQELCQRLLCLGL